MPVIKFNNPIASIGKIVSGEKAGMDFVFYNAGMKNLIILDAKASCGCTAANPTSNVIKPGTDTDLKVVFDSTGKLGLQNKTITVISNDPNQSTTILRISGNVTKVQ